MPLRPLRTLWETTGPGHSRIVPLKRSHPPICEHICPRGASTEAAQPPLQKMVPVGEPSVRPNEPMRSMSESRRPPAAKNEQQRMRPAKRKLAFDSTRRLSEHASRARRSKARRLIGRHGRRVLGAAAQGRRWSFELCMSWPRIARGARRVAALRQWWQERGSHIRVGGCRLLATYGECRPRPTRALPRHDAQRPSALAREDTPSVPCGQSGRRRARCSTGG